MAHIGPFDIETRATIARNLRTMRDDAGYTKGYLAHRVGVSGKSIDNWEKGAAVPQLENMVSLAKVYGMDPRKMFGEIVLEKAAELAEKRQRMEEFRAKMAIQLESTPTPSRIAPKLREEYAPKHEEPDKPEAIITMIPRDDMLSFQQFISRKLVAAARKSSDETVRKLADVLALIDEYEGERSGERRNESQVA